MPSKIAVGDDKVDLIVNIISDNLALFKAREPLNKLVHGPATAKVPRLSD
jgi:hypothetical protein